MRDRKLREDIAALSTRLDRAESHARTQGRDPLEVPMTLQNAQTLADLLIRVIDEIEVIEGDIARGGRIIG